MAFEPVCPLSVDNLIVCNNNRCCPSSSNYYTLLLLHITHIHNNAHIHLYVNAECTKVEYGFASVNKHLQRNLAEASATSTRCREAL